MLSVLNDGVWPGENDARCEKDGISDKVCDVDALIDKLSALVSVMKIVDEGGALVDALDDSRVLIFADPEMEGEAVGDREVVGDIDKTELDEIDREKTEDVDGAPVTDPSTELRAVGELDAVAMKGGDGDTALDEDRMLETSGDDDAGPVAADVAEPQLETDTLLDAETEDDTEVLVLPREESDAVGEIVRRNGLSV